MKNITNFFKTGTSILVGAGVAVTLLTAVLFSAPSANAQVASPNILVGQDLTIGSTGQSVVVLQSLLSELGYLSVPQSIPLGYYGSMTKNALASYQASQSVSPAVGYFGPITKVAMHNQFASRNWLRLLGW